MEFYSTICNLVSEHNVGITTAWRAHDRNNSVILLKWLEQTAGIMSGCTACRFRHSAGLYSYPYSVHRIYKTRGKRASWRTNDWESIALDESLPFRIIYSLSALFRTIDQYRRNCFLSTKNKSLSFCVIILLFIMDTGRITCFLFFKNDVAFLLAHQILNFYL